MSLGDVDVAAELSEGPSKKNYLLKSFVCDVVHDNLGLPNVPSQVGSSETDGGIK